MARVIVAVPSGHNVGLTAVTMGLVRALQQQHIKVGFFKPFSQPKQGESGPEHSTTLARLLCDIESPEPLSLTEAQHLLSSGNEQVLMERVVDRFEGVAAVNDIVIVEGLVSSSQVFYSKHINCLLVSTLDAEVLLVSAPNGKTPEELVEAIEIEAREVRECGNDVIGCVINKIGLSMKTSDYSKTILVRTEVSNFGQIAQDEGSNSAIRTYTEIMEKSLPVIGAIPWQKDMASPTVRELANLLQAHSIRQGTWASRRVSSIAICTMTMPKSLYYMQDGALIITTADRADIILAAAIASLNGIKLAGILLCGGLEIDPNVVILCEKAFQDGLPLLSTGIDIYQTIIMISQTDINIPLDNKDRADAVISNVAGYIDSKKLLPAIETKRESRISPPMFRNMLIKMAQNADKRIVLPEGTEPRTVQAAIICAQRGIARPVLLGNREEIEKVARETGCELPADIETIDPERIYRRYVPQLVELRKAKGMTPKLAEDMLKDSVVVGTMMLKLGEVDGLVSGAVHSTANTVKPAMQIIKTMPDVNLASSIFFMCLPNQVLIYGDCAINQNPTAEELAEIAIASVDSSKAFHIPPRVAMISYSTGTSGAGKDVDKVREATNIVRQRRPDILIDGPMQYDAAINEDVGRSKAPDSPVAGRATVCIFPDLNTGNTTYKAVQRSANVISIGPMLQGLAKPVNDLSRGALVEDIVYTIALTSIQASQSLESKNQTDVLPSAVHTTSTAVPV